MEGKKRNNQDVLGSLSKVTIFSLIVIAIILLPAVTVGNQSNNVDLKKDLSKLQTDGQALFESLYRGIDKVFVPENNNVYDSRFQYWNSTQDIKMGLLLTKTISDMNPKLPSLYDRMVNSNKTVKSLLLRNILKDRKDLMDIWWVDFDHTVDAYLVLEQLGLQYLHIPEINEMDNGNFDLYDYYSNVLNGTNTINGTVVPAWMNVTFKDLFSYRLNQYLGSQNVVLDGTNFVNLGLAVEHGLINLQNIGIQKLTNEMVQNKDKLSYATKILMDNTNQKDFIKSYYSQIISGNTNDPSITFDIPTLSSIIGKYYDQNGINEINGIYAPIELQVKIDSLPSSLIQKRYADIGLIYYTNKELVTYNVTTPNDYWGIDNNTGNLVYYNDTITTQESYYKPVSGTWVDDYNFVPDIPSQRGMFVWNTTIMDQPDAYNISLSLNGQSTSATYTMEKASTDMTKYAKILPASTRGKVKLGVNISQMVITQDKNKIIDQVFNDAKYHDILTYDVLYYGV